MTPVSGTRVVGYLRVSTAEQSDSGAGLEAQRSAIEATVDARGWQLVTMLEDRGVSAKSTKGRDALAAAIALCEAGGADALVVAKLDRLSRSIIDFATLMERARAAGWAIVVLDCDFDMTTPAGELMANMLACFAQFERRVISQRTRDGMAAKKATGTFKAPPGRRSQLDPRTAARIRREHDAGRSLRSIAERLNVDAIPTGHGGKQWHASTVKAVLARVGS
jgi:DNA invertase Pin-like site-specific DNA recombinase